MAFPKHSILQALSVLLLASVLVRCQAPLEPEEEEEEEPIKEADITIAPTKTDLIECPTDCTCTAEGAVDCAGVDLIEFPSKLSDKTRQLSLQVLHTHTHRNYNTHSHFKTVYRKSSVFCLLMSEQQNRRDNSGAHFPSAST